MWTGLLEANITFSKAKMQSIEQQLQPLYDAFKSLESKQEEARRKVSHLFDTLYRVIDFPRFYKLL